MPINHQKWSFISIKAQQERIKTRVVMAIIHSPFMAGHLCSFMPFLSLPWPIKGGLDTSYDDAPPLKPSPPESHALVSKEMSSPLPASFV
jgi:hypothetical protein